MNGINLKTLGLSKSALDDNNDLTSEDGMLKEYKRLSIQLKQLQILKKRSSDQIQGLTREAMQLTDDNAKFGNLNVRFSRNAFCIYQSILRSMEHTPPYFCLCPCEQITRLCGTSRLRNTTNCLHD